VGCTVPCLFQTAESIQEAVSQKDRGVDMETEELSLAALTAGDNETEDAVAALEKSEGMIVDAEKVSEEKEMQHFLVSCYNIFIVDNTVYMIGSHAELTVTIHMIGSLSYNSKDSF